MSTSSSDARPKAAFLFPGQGAQAVGMGMDLYESSAAARAVFDEVDEALGEKFSRIIFEGPEDDLRRTVNTQPGILTVSIACLRAAEEAMGSDRMPVPSMAAGHSLGEYTALVAAGALSLTDGVRLVRERGRLMQYASELAEGGMAAVIGLEEAALAEACREGGTEISNINTADQIVISGEKQAVERTMELATEKGARRVVPLVVAGAFHSRLMQPAQEGLTKAVNDLAFHEPSVPIIANCTGQPITTPEELKAELLSGLLSCVRWKDCVDTMLASGATDFYEMGPGRVLTGTVRRINEEANITNVSDLESLQALSG